MCFRNRCQILSLLNTTVKGLRGPHITATKYYSPMVVEHGNSAELIVDGKAI
jgi:hypothetical protein